MGAHHMRTLFNDGASPAPDAGLTLVGTGGVANVGINTAAPQAALHVVGTVRADGALSATDVAVANAIAVGALASVGALAVAGDVTAGGNVYASGDVTAFSDARLKADLRRIDPAGVSALTGYTYARRDLGGGRHAGLIAQDVRGVLPEAVAETPDGVLTVSYAGVAGMLVNAVNALDSRVRALEGS